MLMYELFRQVASKLFCSDFELINYINPYPAGTESDNPLKPE